MDRSQALVELGQLTLTLNKLKAREQELCDILGIQNPSKEKPARMSEQEVFEVRAGILDAMTSLHDKGIKWIPLQIIAHAAASHLPGIESGEIEKQIRAMAKSEDSPISHNGSRGRASAYSCRETEQVAKEDTDECVPYCGEY